MATLRVQRIAGGVEASGAKLRVARLVAGVEATPAAPPTLRVRRITAGVETSQVTFPVTASSNITSAARTGTVIQFTGSATPPGGESVVSWLWTALSSDAPPLSSRTVQNPTARVNPQLTARPMLWSLTVTSTSGTTSTTTVAVPFAAAKYRTIGLDGSVRPFDWIGRVPAPSGPPPNPVPKLRVRRVTLGVVAPADEPPPSEVTMLTGGTVRIDRVNTLAEDFATGETDYGNLQITKQFHSGGNLPATQPTPFPSDVLVIQHWSKDTNFPFNMDGTWKGATPAEQAANETKWRTYINSITDGMVTYQHEPERPGFFASGEDFVNEFNAVRAKVRAVRTDLPVWMISSGYNYRSGNPGYDGSYITGLRQNGTRYTIAADGFGFDNYRSGLNDVTQGMKVIPMQDRNEFQRWKSLIIAGKPWGITECGFGRVTWPDTVEGQERAAVVAAQRLSAVPASHTWLRTHGAYCFMYWFSNIGGNPGQGDEDWRPEDAAFKSMYQALPRGS